MTVLHLRTDPRDCDVSLCKSAFSPSLNVSQEIYMNVVPITCSVLKHWLLSGSELVVGSQNEPTTSNLSGQSPHFTRRVDEEQHVLS